MLGHVLSRSAKKHNCNNTDTTVCVQGQSGDRQDHMYIMHDQRPELGASSLGLRWCVG